MNTYYVYMMSAGNFIKIGHSANPEKRVEQMQTGNPHEIEIIALLPFDSKKQAHNEEKRLHFMLKKHNFRGEWFKKSCLKTAFKFSIYQEVSNKEKKKGYRPKIAKWNKAQRYDAGLAYEANKYI